MKFLRITLDQIEETGLVLAGIHVADAFTKIGLHVHALASWKVGQAEWASDVHRGSLSSSSDLPNARVQLKQQQARILWQSQTASLRLEKRACSPSCCGLRRGSCPHRKHHDN